MGNSFTRVDKQIKEAVAKAIPPPPKCSVERSEAATWQKTLADTQKTYDEKRLKADACSPETAAARAAAGSGPSECQVNDVELNMARTDVATKDAKWATCYPEQAILRVLNELMIESQAYERRILQEQREANAAFDTKNVAINKLANSARTMYNTLFEKEKTLATLVSSRQNTEQLERRERRMFLDSDPQSGTGGAPGVRTMDDRVLLTFWITYGVAVIAGTILILQLYGVQLNATDMKSKVGITAVVALGAYALAYYFISNFG
jgi:hypothetical protein